MTALPERAGLMRTFAPSEESAAPARRTLDEASLLIADTTRPRDTLSPAAQRIMDLLLPGNLSVAETSAHLKLPAAATKVITAALVETGHLIARTPAPAQQQHDIGLLERILDGLQKL